MDHLLGLVVLHHQKALAPRLGVFLDASERGLHAFGGRRLGHERERAAGKAVLAILVERDDLNRNMPGERILLELAQNRPAQHVGQEHVERHRRGLVLLGEVEGIGPPHRHQHLEALVARQLDHDARVVRVVLDNEQDRIAGLDGEMVIQNLLERTLRQNAGMDDGRMRCCRGGGRHRFGC